jgi:hypothetical protein
MNYSSRFWLYAPLGMFLALAAWAGLHWWNAASAFNRKLDAMKGREAVPGIVIDWQSKTLSGFPFNIDVVFTGLSVKGAGAHGPFAWSSEKFALHTLTYERQKQVMEASGSQHLTYVDEYGRARDARFLPGALHASAVSDSHGLARFDIDILDLGSKDLAVRRMQFHLRRNPDGKDIDLMARIDGVTSRVAGKTVLMEFYSTLTEAAALTPLLRGEMSWPGAIAAWQSRGGKVKPGSFKATLRPAQRDLTPENTANPFAPLY